MKRIFPRGLPDGGDARRGGRPTGGAEEVVPPVMAFCRARLPERIMNSGVRRSLEAARAARSPDVILRVVLLSPLYPVPLLPLSRPPLVLSLFFSFSLARSAVLDDLKIGCIPFLLSSLCSRASGTRAMTE